MKDKKETKVATYIPAQHGFQAVELIWQTTDESGKTGNWICISSGPERVMQELSQDKTKG
jgi:hypothetical protein